MNLYGIPVSLEEESARSEGERLLRWQWMAEEPRKQTCVYCNQQPLLQLYLLAADGSSR